MPVLTDFGSFLCVVQNASIPPNRTTMLHGPFFPMTTLSLQLERASAKLIGGIARECWYARIFFVGKAQAGVRPVPQVRDRPLDFPPSMKVFSFLLCRLSLAVVGERNLAAQSIRLLLFREQNFE